ncbi:MAG: hypothetical protein ACOXZM_09965 [Eubacteriales bacterium]|jgi:L-arabinose isomerase
MIRSFEEATTDVFGDILTKKREKRRLRVGLLLCGYFEYWRMYPELEAMVKADLAVVTRRIGELPVTLTVPEMCDTLDAAEDAGRRFEDEKIDAVIVVGGTYITDFITLHALNHVPNVPVLLFSIQTAQDVDPASDYCHSLRNSGIIGTSQLTGTFRKLGRKFRTVVGSLNDDRAYGKIRTWIAALQAILDIKERNIGVIGHVFRGMYDLELSKTFLKATFDVNVIYIQSEHLTGEWEKVTDAESEALADTLLTRFRTRDITRDDIVRACRLGIAMGRLAERFRLDALCFLDQHFLQRMTRTSARLGASLLIENDRLDAVCCEGDLGGLVTMLLYRSLTGEAGLMGEWGEYDETLNAALVIGHGIASPKLATSDADITITPTPEEWGFDGNGANYEFIMKPGPVTIAHLLETPDGYRMLLSGAESLSYPTIRYSELHAMLKVVTPVKEYLEKMLDAGIAHHCIIAPGDVTDALRTVAETLGLAVLTPERL